MPHSTLLLNGVRLIADLSGTLFWPERGVLAVADLHLEKGSGFARRGQMLPPYDTRATLDRLAAAIDRVKPTLVICVGDSFHDRDAADRLDPGDRDRIRRLTDACDWIWVAGNHDPAPPADLGGRVTAEITLGALTFRHEARPDAVGEISGHYHPVAAIRTRSGRVRARCFAADGQRLILPSFGAYTGGLNVLDPALSGLLSRPFDVHVLGQGRVHAFPSHRLEPDPRRSANP
jgi:DNA ligase-associated metallophosphoesterase